MANHLDALARRVEQDPYFLSCFLTLHAKSEGLDEPALARSLGCSTETLALVRLCRAPGMEPGQFRKDTDEITKRFQLRPHSLVQAVRLGQAIFHMSHPESTETGTLMAARDLKNDLDAKRHGGAS